MTSCDAAAGLSTLPVHFLLVEVLMSVSAQFSLNETLAMSLSLKLILGLFKYDSFIHVLWYKKDFFFLAEKWKTQINPETSN